MYDENKLIDRFYNSYMEGKKDKKKMKMDNPNEIKPTFKLKISGYEKDEFKGSSEIPLIPTEKEDLLTGTSFDFRGEKERVDVKFNISGTFTNIGVDFGKISFKNFRELMINSILDDKKLLRTCLEVEITGSDDE